MDNELLCAKIEALAVMTALTLTQSRFRQNLQERWDVNIVLTKLVFTASVAKTARKSYPRHVMLRKLGMGQGKS
jgi:hypothetical protein